MALRHSEYYKLTVVCTETKIRNEFTVEEVIYEDDMMLFYISVKYL